MNDFKIIDKKIAYVENFLKKLTKEENELKKQLDITTETKGDDDFSFSKIYKDEVFITNYPGLDIKD